MEVGFRYGRKCEMASKTEEKERCFVIMPISDPEEYEDGHFKNVYEDIFKPAIEAAGYEAFRVDECASSNLIQVSIIDEIISAPMALCDLSTRNPNVLFELGIRQAFDLPVVLVQEEGTKRIFDISNINTIDYRSKLIYREVIEDRVTISKGIKSTKDDKDGINSIVKLLEIGKKAELQDDKMSENQELKFMIKSLANEVNQINNSLMRLKLESSVLNSINNRIIEPIDEVDKIDKLMTMRRRTLKNKKYKVYEVAKALEVESSWLINILQILRPEQMTHMSNMSVDDFDFLIEYYKKNYF